MVSTGVIRAVNPVSLAHASSVTKIPRFASPIAPVIRPNLLTSQLMGCCPTCAAGGPVGLTGLGSFVPPDYGTLRGNGGSYGIFKILSSGELPSAGLGKGASGANAAYYNTRSWSSGLRGLGKGASGANAAYYNTRSWSSGLRGLGQDFTSTGDTSVDNLSTSYTQILNSLPTGDSGSTSVSNPLSEANQIVPTQNALMAYLGTITNQIRTGQNPSLATLQQLYTNVWTAFTNFIKFVLSPKFIVRMASGQALNTVMPYCDGSCGYAVPLGQTANPTQQGCLPWGDGTIGGIGTNGMLGAIARAINKAGGSIPSLTTPQQAANTSAATSGAAPAYSPTGAATTSTIAGISTSTLLLIGLGVLLLSRMH